MAELRSASGGGGRDRAELLDHLNVDAQVVVASLTLLVEGVADLLEASIPRDRAVNNAAIVPVLRSAMEVAGQVAWLLQQGIGSDTRARRFLIWRFADLAEQRRLLRKFRILDHENQEALAELDGSERALIDAVERAGWQVQETIGVGGTKRSAALLSIDDKREQLPKNEDLIGLVSSTPSIYGLLSAHAHGRRFALLQGLKTTDHADGTTSAELASVGLPTNLAITFAALSIDWPSRLLASWNGVASDRLHAEVLKLSRRAGINN